MSLGNMVLEYGNQNAITDIGVGALMLYTGVEGAVLNVKVNLSSLDNQELKKYYGNECEEILNKAALIKNNILATVHNNI